MAPSLEFGCGTVAKGVGAIGLACKAHIGTCDNAACQAEVMAEAAKAGVPFVRMPKPEATA